MTVQFQQSDIELFSAVSGDNNPLHLSTDYARQTSFGQPVVFGALSTLFALGNLSSEQLGRIKKITADFHRPMFVGVSYSFEVRNTATGLQVRAFDGSANLLTCTVTLGENSRATSFASGKPHFRNSEAANVDIEHIRPNFTIEGYYHLNEEELPKLLNRTRCATVPGWVVEALLWSSYLVGMEMPGRSALFSRCALEFHDEVDRPSTGSGLEYRAEVKGLQTSLGQLKLSAELKGNLGGTVSASLIAFARQSVSVEVPDVRVPDSALSGRVALVLGASRGFGASLAIALAQAGAMVICASRSDAKWKDQIGDSLLPRFRFTTLEIGDAVALADAREKILDEFGRLDLLVCSAFPPIPSLRLEENSIDRIARYISDSVSLVLAPICQFAADLNESSGTLAVISSSAVEQPVRDWPHYVSAKSACESLVRVAALQYSKIRALVYRPERMLTDMTNTPMGRVEAKNPAQVASRLVEALVRTSAKPGFEVITDCRESSSQLAKSREEVLDEVITNA